MPDDAFAADPLARDPLAGESAWAAYGALVTAGFVAAAIFGFGGRPLTMAVGAGAAALATASARVTTLPGVVALVGVTPATAAAIGGGRGRELVAVLALLVASAWRADRMSAALGAAGVLVLAAGVAVGRFGGDADRFGLDPGNSRAAAWLLAAAAALLVFAAVAPVRPGPLTLLIAPGTLAGLAAAGGLDTPHITVAAAGIVAVAATVIDRPAASLAALAISASAAVDEPAVAGLLGAAALLVAAFPARPVPVAVLSAVPGLTGLAAVVAAHPTSRAVGLAGFAAVCTTATVLRVDTTRWLPARLEPALWPVIALAAWVVAAPQTWGWLGPLPGPVAVSGRAAAAAGAIVAVVLAASATAGRYATARR